jgi:hypothetical protein
MVQMNLNNQAVTHLEELKMLRMNYYNQLNNDIESHSIYMKQKVQEYRNIIKDIDLEIEKEQRKSRKLDLENKNGEKRTNKKE